MTGAEPFKGARFDHAAVERIARKEFGVTFHIKLVRRRLKRSWGWAQVWPWRIARVVIDSQHSTVEEALRTLAHELTHVARVERMGWHSFIIEHKVEESLAEEDRPSEIEAIAAEERWALLLPAIR